MISGYKVNNEKVLGWVIIALAAFNDGALERWGFGGRKAFEVKFGVSPDSFFGSESWKAYYENPNVWNKIMGVFDFYHVSDDVRKMGYIAGGVILGRGGAKVNTSLSHYLIDYTVAMAVSGFVKRVGDKLVKSWQDEK